jgi:hypothetical protein
MTIRCALPIVALNLKMFQNLSRIFSLPLRWDFGDVPSRGASKEKEKNKGEENAFRTCRLCEEEKGLGTQFGWWLPK